MAETSATRSLVSRVALVTGGARGLGLEISRQLAALGAHVIIAARDMAKAEYAARSLRGAGLDAEALNLDVTRAADHKAAVAALAGPDRR